MACQYELSKRKRTANVRAPFHHRKYEISRSGSEVANKGERTTKKQNYCKAVISSYRDSVIDSFQPAKFTVSPFTRTESYLIIRVQAAGETMFAGEAPLTAIKLRLKARRRLCSIVLRNA